MTTLVPPRHQQASRNSSMAVPMTPHLPTGVSTRTREGRTASTIARYSWAAARIGMGLTFLWAFVDKLFGFGYATPAGKGWIDGGSPTKGFLSGSEGPFAGFYHAIAGTTFANVAFMVGLAGIGLALLLGIGMRVAAGAGALMLTMMYTVVLPPTTNPVFDDHVILALLLVGLAAVTAGNTLGLGRRWANVGLVKRMPWLK
jgi:thiosulfate dehydrogenase [quinone] large subunit